ncbi:MAG: TetR/AcrR family transcriptional regulator [Gemmatimonadota bacterium]
MSRKRTDPRRRGRPRSPEVERAILEAALAVLADAGWDGLTMEAIAERGGVGKAAIYRRWDSKAGVLAAAVDLLVRGIRIPDTGSIRGDLLALMHGAVDLYSGQSGRLMPGLIAAMAREPSVAAAVRHGFLVPRRAALRAVLERGVARGELRADLDRELALDVMGGPLFYRLLVTGGPIDRTLAEGTVEVMLRGFS